jgi:hypothetical protein
MFIAASRRAQHVNTMYLQVPVSHGANSYKPSAISPDLFPVEPAMDSPSDPSNR